MLKRLPPLTLDTLEDHMVLVEGGEVEYDQMYAGKLNKEKYILQDFEICRYPVTNELWDQVRNARTNQTVPSRKPKVKQTWNDAVVFCNELSLLCGKNPAYVFESFGNFKKNLDDPNRFFMTCHLDPKADGFRLPYEPEWMYAAKGGKYHKGFQFANSPNLTEVAWWDRNSGNLEQPVGLLIPNELGLYDVSGNVDEWVSNPRNMDSTPREEIVDNSQLNLVGSGSSGLKGGSWFYSDLDVFDLSHRPIKTGDFTASIFGFRLCRSEF